MKVMIVDDHKEVRRMIRSFIGDLVDEFFECGQGNDALETYATNVPDLVLMDIQMGTGADGFAATRKIKAAFPEAEIVIVSQWDSPTLREEARECGAAAYLNKSDLGPLRDLLQTE
jgi:two-component system, NarL family, invasion response regulator UvrY